MKKKPKQSAEEFLNTAKPIYGEHGYSRATVIQLMEQYAEQQDEWISVNDYLPEAHESTHKGLFSLPVIVYLDNGDTTTALYQPKGNMWIDDRFEYEFDSLDPEIILWKPFELP